MHITRTCTQTRNLMGKISISLQILVGFAGSTRMFTISRAKIRKLLHQIRTGFADSMILTEVQAHAHTKKKGNCTCNVKGRSKKIASPNPSRDPSNTILLTVLPVDKHPMTALSMSDIPHSPSEYNFRFPAHIVFFNGMVVSNAVFVGEAP